MATKKEAPEKSVEKKEGVKKEKVKKEAAPVAAVEAPPVAAAAPVPAVKPATKSTKIGKLLPKNKSRLPRREKKAQKKAAGRL